MNIGITGGIGSGKTTICKIFETLGIPVYYADERAKRLMVENENITEQIKLLFGIKAYHDDGSLNKEYIANIAFGNPKKLSKLNYIIHPAVRRDSLAWSRAQKKSPYNIKEAALLIESESYKDLDKLILVTAPWETRLKRVMQRDNVSEEEVTLRADKQMPESEKIAYADFTIDNDGHHSLVQQVHDLHQKILALI